MTGGTGKKGHGSTIIAAAGELDVSSSQHWPFARDDADVVGLCLVHRIDSRRRPCGARRMEEQPPYVCPSTQTQDGATQNRGHMGRHFACRTGLVDSPSRSSASHDQELQRHEHIEEDPYEGVKHDSTTTHRSSQDPSAPAQAFHLITPSQKKRDQILRQNKANEELLAHMRALRPEVTEGGDTLGGVTTLEPLTDAEIRRRRVSKLYKPRNRLSRVAANMPTGTPLGHPQVSAPAASAISAAASADGDRVQAAVSELEEEGFDEEAAGHALCLADGDIEAARGLLLHAMDDIAAAVAKQQEQAAADASGLARILSGNVAPRDTTMRRALLSTVAGVVDAAGKDSTKRRLNPSASGFAKAGLSSPLGLVLLDWSGFKFMPRGEDAGTGSGPRWVAQDDVSAPMLQRRARVLREHASAGQANASANPSQTSSAKEVPSTFVCPINDELMVDPVIAADGHTYERASIELWFSRVPEPALPRSPMTNQSLPNRVLIPNIAVRQMIVQWRESA